MKNNSKSEKNKDCLYTYKKLALANTESVTDNREVFLQCIGEDILTACRSIDKNSFVKDVGIFFDFPFLDNSYKVTVYKYKKDDFDCFDDDYDDWGVDG